MASIATPSVYLPRFDYQTLIYALYCCRSWLLYEYAYDIVAPILSRTQAMII